jgi:DedD protein
MDEALKARLIGAAVLVALAVILIPELLSGRKPAGAGDGAATGPGGARTFIIDLPGNTPGPSPAPTPAAGPGRVTAQPTTPSPGAARDAGPAAPAAGNSGGPAAAAEVAAKASPAPATDVAAKAPQGSATPTAVSAPATATATPPAPSSPPRGGWVVQVGAFGSAATADKMADQLRSAGFKAFVSPVSRSGKTLQRVRVGPESDRARADSLAASLKARGLPATVVANE